MGHRIERIGNQVPTQKGDQDQVLADIFSECVIQEESREPIWQLLTDGSSRLVGAGAGLVLTTPEGKIIEYALKYQFKATNHVAEYEAVIAGLQLCKALEVKRISLKTDSQLVMNQILREFEAREENMQKYLKKTQELMSEF